LKFRSFKTSRDFHKWTGFVCAIFLLILSVSGVLLMHRDSLDLDQIEISSRYLPDKYFHLVKDKFKIQAVAVDPTDSRILFTGTANGLFRSKDGGDTWRPLHEGLRDENIRAIAIHPSQPTMIYVGTAKGVYLSEDGGDHWTDWFEESSGLANINIQDLAIHPNNPEILFAATYGGLFVSEDSGDTWERSFDGKGQAGSPDVGFICFSSRARSIYIGTSNGIFKSTDGGEHWQKKWEDTLPFSASLLSLDTDPEFIYAGTSKGLYKSFNRGITWVQDSTPKEETVKQLLVDRNRTTHIYMRTASHLFLSPDGGDTWNILEFSLSNNDTLELFTLVGTEAHTTPTLIAGTSGGLFISKNGGLNWKETSLANTIQNKSGGHLKMDLVKLMTEIHTGRFFGDYVYLLVDIATIGLILLVFSGFAMTLYRRRVSASKKVQAQVTEDEAVDNLLNIQETADDLSQESMKIHDMIEHINSHLSKCRTVYVSKEKKEIDKIGKHITTLDKKMHHLMERIEEFYKLSQN
jgi:photosystem II stability/assembly factor-like uncharacterized protein